MPRLMLIVGIVLASSFGTARAQTGPDYLYWRFTSSVNPISTSLSDLGLDGTITGVFDTFLSELDRRQWPLIIIRRIDALSDLDQRRLIMRLQAQLDGGARMLVHLAELEDMPRMQAFLGLEGAQDIIEPREIRPAGDPGHPAQRWALLVGSDAPDDYGASLIPGGGTKALCNFVDGTTASVLAYDGRVIVNGWEPEGWSGFSGRLAATDNLNWLLGCAADLDRSGRLDLFDFLEFQTLFAAGDPAADWFCYDGRLDVFDFLAFFNWFETRCFAF